MGHDRETLERESDMLAAFTFGTHEWKLSEERNLHLKILMLYIRIMMYWWLIWKPTTCGQNYELREHLPSGTLSSTLLTSLKTGMEWSVLPCILTVQIGLDRISIDDGYFCLLAIFLNNMFSLFFENFIHVCNVFWSCLLPHFPFPNPLGFRLLVFFILTDILN